ncbi:SEC14 cytosolic factor family protein / phosphoglyceride transfer family protein [Zea mays]|uniref:SEC14 cytosolic factor family protein / phosphoglyceride transfer family protein n=1 Tax=Zea mays TaxID=4577 RepID=A0A1D6M8C3_MAIZE|nr:SEC14 cytosolic factor family protein / phosphoglyceride transfer family protein [Zea mays]AQK87170.1 SEC14 cytosolic factor family protein / phosphoglyceride transfer family protein [Zea mays]AQK87190.1 SEC14 cytosolic factor family protein / phosphoglyceride transfer family protein [Zea mays]AQK87192.1 SEC14 cytosolic factor family protein / phosphoglyceride transfer family protein [Zea mays]AQK87197.1 SEC14 cytosolic factor family protein / phosphoglyceride transfer family protein [Zea ma
MQMMRSFITVVQENYPNRLGVLFVIRLPPVVRVIAQTFLQIAISHGIRGDEDDIASKSAPPASIDGARYGFEPPVLQSSHQVDSSQWWSDSSRRWSDPADRLMAKRTTPCPGVLPALHRDC